MENINFLKKPAVIKQTTLSHASLYGRIRMGIFPPPTKLGRTSVWIASEINAICKAHAAGFNDEQLRELVAELEAKRKDLGR
ncbi:AlpA family transcriptional regulator [Nitrosomonas sp. Nm132]|jgi:prophage regulatory protein|uniref:helix-turn-helix transcriptional regulator n=1 Tax=Nitrosomonas sp. Nm132 TaxID=1881053 RepID=UPI00088F317C|nr:AlpA family phage regulatory protein [Nitrosomonas sp. Nm132]SDH99986.1 prophage regulatory protein [Nitrosomonas sp. Nm132]